MAVELAEQVVMASSTLSSYLGLSFAVFLGLLPHSYNDHLAELHGKNRRLFLKLIHAEDQLRHMQSRRQEDAKANARVVEIFATHRNQWQAEERRLRQQIELLEARVVELEKSEAEFGDVVERLQREVDERKESIKSKESYGSSLVGRMGRIRVSEGLEMLQNNVGFSGRGVDGDQIGHFVGYQSGFHSFHGFSASSCSAQNVQKYDTSHDPLYQAKKFMPRESPWKTDGESMGIAPKMKLLEQELVAMDKTGGEECSKLLSMLRKQAKRYQSLSTKIDELCQRMQASDPGEQTLSSELRTQRQTEFLLETIRMQQRAAETNQKLMALHLEAKKNGWGDGELNLAGVSTRRSIDSIRSCFRELQRSIEIWLARMMGDLEGVLARDGVSRVSEYYIPKYPLLGKSNLY